MLEQTLTVSEFIDLVNQTLEFAYPRVTVEGEVSGFSQRQNKWIFFDLKDKDSSVNCFMPKWQLKTAVEDGMSVRVVAVPKLTRWGKFSLTVETVEPVGEGALRRAFELLRNKLEQEGLFAPERKRSLPEYPARVGLVASTESAAYKDFVKILNARWGGVTVLAADVQVQGEPAPAQIVAALDYFNQLAEPVDLVVLTRGGGSLEDLQAFNTEPVARAVAASRTAVVAGVGHEQDVTLVDLVADVRASTPSNAAELIVPDRREIVASLSAKQRELVMRINQRISHLRQTVNHSATVLSRFLKLPADRVDALSRQLRTGLDQAVKTHKQQLLALYRTLTNLDPKRVLARGYAIARVGERVVRSGRDVTVGDELDIELSKDRLNTEVKGINLEK